MIARIAAAIAATLALPSPVSAQAIEACDAPWLDPDHVRAILQVELADRWVPAIDAIVVRVEECETDLPRLSLIAPDREPTSMTLRLGAVAPRARTRFVALIVAELLRSQVETPAEASATEPEPPPELVPAPVVAEPAAPGAETPDVSPAVETVAPEPEPPAAVTGPAAAWDALMLAAPAPTEEPTPTEELATPAASSPWRLGVSLAARVFVAPLTVAGLVDVTLRFDRLLLVIGGGGTELGSSAGTVRLGQLTGAVGVRLLEHRGRVRIGWDLRGDAGAAVASGQPADFAVGSTTFTFVLAASTQLEIVWPAGPLELGFTTDFGYQRGIVETGPFVFGGLGGVFASLGGTVTWSL